MSFSDGLRGQQQQQKQQQLNHHHLHQQLRHNLHHHQSQPRSLVHPSRQPSPNSSANTSYSSISSTTTTLLSPVSSTESNQLSTSALPSSSAPRNSLNRQSSTSIGSTGLGTVSTSEVKMFPTKSGIKQRVSVHRPLAVQQQLQQHQNQLHQKHQLQNRYQHQSKPSSFIPILAHDQSSNPKKPSPSHPDDVLGTRTYSSPVAPDSSDLTSNTSTTSNLKSHPLNQSPTVEKTSSTLNDNQLTPNSQTHSSNIRTIDSTKPSKPILELSLHDPITSDSMLGLDLDFLSFSQPPNHDLLAGLGPRLNSAVKQTQSTMVISDGLTPTGPRIIRASNSNINSSGRGYDGRQIVDSSAKISGSYRPSDSQRPPSQSSVASNRSTTPNLSQCSLRSNQELIPSSLPNSSSPSSASPPSESSSPPTSCDRHAAPKLASKTKVNQVKDSSPFLLDLDISGRGPSLAYGKISTSNPSEDEDGDEFYANPTMVKPNNSARQQTLLPSSKAPSRRDSAHDEDPYLSSSPTDEGSDDEEDAHSVQYDGSSSDHHHTYQSVSPSPSLSVNPSSAQSINGPYLSRSQRRAPSPAYSTGGLSMSSTTSGAIKKSINIFKPFQKTTTTQDSRNFRNNQHDIYPSPVSSSTSFNTSESKNSKSSLYKGSNRIVRLISRVTGQTQQPQPGIDPPRGAASSTNPSTKQTPRPQHIKRKASLSNLLDSITDTLTISNAKSSKVASPTDPVALREKSSMRKKSLELLMIKKPQRPNFHDSKPQQQGDLGSKEPNKPTSLETSDAENKKQPMLRGRRSFDMLRSKFRTGGRKSMDDLSQYDNPKDEARKTGASKQSTGLSVNTGVSSAKPLMRRAESDTLINSAKPQSSSSSSPTLAALKASKSFAEGPNDSSNTQPNRSSGQAENLSSSLSHHRKITEGSSSLHIEGHSPAQNQDRTFSSSRSSPETPKVLDDLFEEEFSQLEVMMNSFIEFQHQQYQAHHQGLRSELSLGLSNLLNPLLKSSQDFILTHQHVGSTSSSRKDQGRTPLSNSPDGLVGYKNLNKAKWHRKILFGWLELIFNELREPQPVSRGTCLDGAAGILESPFLASHLLSSNIEDVKLYRSNLVSVLNFAIDKLNDKAVYANTLVFAGRMLSLALFRIEGVGRKLLRALPPVKRMSMRRLLDEMANNQISESLSQPPNMLPFPAYLRELCFSMDLNSYCKVFSSTSVENDSLLVQEGDLTVEMSGNWLIRWTASDSDLPFAFYRAYHRQLATYLRPQPSGIVNPSTLISMPGFLFIAASFLDKCDSLVHRSLRSVTTLGPNANNFNAGESANLAMGAKPKVLELAHRRLVSTALDIVGGPPRSMTTDGRSRETKLDESGQRRCFFGGLLNLWIRAISKRTSMWDTRSVFLLLDLLDGLFYTVLYTAPTNPSSPSQSNLENADPSVPQLVESSLDLFDLGFILTVVRKILVTADNTVCVMRAIAFVYSQFEVLTAKTPILEELCLETLLEPAIFQHLFLHWNSGVRGYYMRLLVWRLSRLGGIGNTPNAAKGHSMIEGNNLTPARPPKSKEVIKIILTFNSRLDAVRNRHDELSPEAEFLGASQDEYRKKRSTICSTRGVSDQPWAIGELPAEVVCEEAVNASNDDQITSGRSPGNESQQNSTGDKPSVAKVVSWLRVVKRLGGGNSLKAVTNKGRGDVRRGGPIGEEGSEVYNQRIIMDRMRDESVNEGIIKSGKAAESQLDKVDEKIQLDELSEIENQRSQASSEERFENQDAIERKPGKSDSSPRSSIGQSPDSPTFFKFEFEIGADIPRSDSFDTPVSTPAPSEESPSSNAVVLINGNAAAKAAANSGPQNSTNGQNNNSGNGNSSSSGHQGRVSSRFSKRASLLPPAALSMLKENEAFPDVPSLPSQYKNSQKQKEIDEVDSVYPKKLHQYAIRALVEYEQSLEEEFEWKEKLKEEEMLMIEEEEEERKQQQHQGGGRGGLNEGGRTDGTDENGNKKKSRTEELESIVPRLAVSWPLSFSEDE